MTKHTEIPDDIRAEGRALQIKIETIRRIVESWIEWSRKSRSWEGLATDGNTVIMSLPVPCWPTHSMLENWVLTLKQTEAAVSPTKTEGAE